MWFGCKLFAVSFTFFFEPVRPCLKNAWGVEQRERTGCTSQPQVPSTALRTGYDYASRDRAARGSAQDDRLYRKRLEIESGYGFVFLAIFGTAEGLLFPAEFEGLRVFGSAEVFALRGARASKVISNACLIASGDCSAGSKCRSRAIALGIPRNTAKVIRSRL